jgi:hypothetical protein
MEEDGQLTVRPPKAHGTNAELVVFEMMADIESLIRRSLGHSFMHDSWPILQTLLRAHVVGREITLSDLWMVADQPLERTLQCVERLVLQGLVECDPALMTRRADGPVRLTAAGVSRAESLAEGIVETLTTACRRAGLDPFARRPFIRQVMAEGEAAPGSRQVGSTA